MKRIISLLIAIISLLSAFSLVGCANESENKPTNPVVLLNSYESNSELYTMAANGVLGKISVNKEEEFLTEGKQSAKISVMHDPWQYRTPSILQSTNIEYRNENYNDFGKVKHFIFDIYNAGTVAKTIGVQLVYTMSGDASRFYVNTGSVQQYYTLQPNTWTSVRFDVPREYLPTVKETSKDSIYYGQNINKVIAINVSFDRPTDADDHYYIDNFRLYRSQSGFGTIDMALKEDEICSFDYLWQMETLTSFGTISPSLNLVNNVISTETGTALKMTLPASETAGSCGFYLGQSLLKMVNWKSYDDDDELCFDVYIPEVGGYDNLFIRLVGYGGWIVDDHYYSLPKGEWITFRYSVARINGGINSYGDRVFANMNNVGFYVSLQPSETESVMYFDNIRMERN